MIFIFFFILNMPFKKIGMISFKPIKISGMGGGGNEHLTFSPYPLRYTQYSVYDIIIGFYVTYDYRLNTVTSIYYYFGFY